MAWTPAPQPQLQPVPQAAPQAAPQPPLQPEQPPLQPPLQQELPQAQQLQAPCRNSAEAVLSARSFAARSLARTPREFSVLADQLT